MKITKSQLKEIIRENLESLPMENLIGGISSLVDGMDPELVGVVFTTVFKNIEGSTPGSEEEEAADAQPPIGFGREPEQMSDKAPDRIGFEEGLLRMIKEEISSDSALIDAINNKIDNLDVSVDYLAASVTGEDPLALGYGQSAFGRAARKKKAPAELGEIIQKEIDDLLDEVSSEKQRRWACAQKDKSADERADSLSASEAEEMCTSKVEEEET